MDELNRLVEGIVPPARTSFGIDAPVVVLAGYEARIVRSLLGMLRALVPSDARIPKKAGDVASRLLDVLGPRIDEELRNKGGEKTSVHVAAWTAVVDAHEGRSFDGEVVEKALRDLLGVATVGFGVEEADLRDAFDMMYDLPF